MVFGNSWYHSIDEAEKKACKEDCKKLPHPEECNDDEAQKTCKKLKDVNGPMKVFCFYFRHIFLTMQLSLMDSVRRNA